MKESIKKRIDAVRRRAVPEGYISENHQLRPVEWQHEKVGKYLTLHNEFSNNTGEYPVATSSRQGLMLQSEYYSDQRYEETAGGFHVVPVGYVTYRHMSDDDIFRFNVNKMGQPVLVSPEYPVFTTREGLNQDLLVAYLNNMKEFRAYCSAQKKGSTRTRMYFGRLGEFTMPIPSVAEQQKIVEILATCDRVIELKQQLLEEKRRQKRWLMQKLLNPNSGVQLPSCSGKWKRWRLQDLGIFSKGSGISNEDCSSGACPCIKYGDIYVAYDEFFVDAISHTEDEVFNKAPIVHKGTLLFTGSGEDPKEIGKCTAYLGEEPIAVGGDIIVMRPKETVVNPLFLAYVLNSYSAIKQKAYLGQGYSVVHIYAEDVKKISVDIPAEIETQKEIAKIIMASNHEIHLLEDEIASWKQKKKALMQFLLTGLVRVNA